MYVSVKGGEAAIEASRAVLADTRRGDRALPQIAVAQIAEQLGLAVDRVIGEASLYDRELAALAIKQAQGDLQEAAFLLRAFRSTLPRFCASLPIDTTRMTLARRICATHKDLPGGQILGPTYDYTHRLLEFGLLADEEPPPAPQADPPVAAELPRATAALEAEGLLRREPDDNSPPPDLTREPLSFPAPRALRLQALARGDEGFVLAMGYSTQRGYGNTHPFAAEIRYGTVTVEIVPEELGFPVEIGDIAVTECQMVNQFRGSKTEPPQFTRGYGLVFGHAERRAMGMALVDRALQARELGEDVVAPVQDEEFVLSHADHVEASGFVQHLKLPHYVDFQSELELIRTLRAEARNQADTLREAAE